MDFIADNAMHYINTFGTGVFIGYVLIVLRAVCMWVIRRNSMINSRFLAFIEFSLVNRAFRKIRPLGLEALVYHPIIDGKKITVKDFIEDDKIVYKDPIILEQDRHLKNLVYSTAFSSHIIFFKNDDYSVKGYFHHLETDIKKVYSASIKINEGQNNG